MTHEQTGVWIHDDEYFSGRWKCSRCGEDIYFNGINPIYAAYRYCPYCGTRMVLKPKEMQALMRMGKYGTPGALIKALEQMPPESPLFIMFDADIDTSEFGHIVEAFTGDDIGNNALTGNCFLLVDGEHTDGTSKER